MKKTKKWVRAIAVFMAVLLAAASMPDIGTGTGIGTAEVQAASISRLFNQEVRKQKKRTTYIVYVEAKNIKDRPDAYAVGFCQTRPDVDGYQIAWCGASYENPAGTWVYCNISSSDSMPSAGTGMAYTRTQYKFKVRTYKYINGKTYYSRWSKVKKIKVPKKAGKVKYKVFTS